MARQVPMTGVATTTDWADSDNPALMAWRRHGLLLGLGLLALLVAYWPAFQSLGRTWWNSASYAHGWLVVPIVGYLIWQRHETLARLTPTASPMGLLALAALVALWLVARAAEVLLIQQFAVVAMVVALGYSLLGWRVVWAIAFPLAYLFFAVPVGEGLVPVLQDITAWMTVQGLKLTGLPVLLEGRHIRIPTGDFLVAEACSGVRYLIASVALGCLYAYLSYRSLWRRLAFVTLAVVLPIVANGIRAYGIVMLAHLSNHRLAVGVDHLIYGWLFFGAVIFLMFWLGNLWRESPVVALSTATEPVSTEPGRPLRLGAVVLLGGLLLILGPLAALRMQASPGASGAPFEAPPAPVDWRGPLAAAPDWTPRYHGASRQFQGRYLDPAGMAVTLFGVVYYQQRQGHELIHYDNALYDPQRWAFEAEGSREIVLANRTLRARETRLRGESGRRRVIWSWYRIGVHQTISPARAKLLEAWTRLRGGGAGSHLFALASDYDYVPDEARGRLRGFLQPLAAGPGAASLFAE